MQLISYFSIFEKIIKILLNNINNEPHLDLTGIKTQIVLIPFLVTIIT